MYISQVNSKVKLSTQLYIFLDILVWGVLYFKQGDKFDALDKRNLLIYFDLLKIKSNMIYSIKI